MIRYYFDVHVHGVVYHMLREREIDVIRAQDDKMGEATDEELLQRATEAGRVLVTGDKDFFEIANAFQKNQQYFCGIIFFRPTQITIKNMADDLLLIAQLANLEDLQNLVTYLPL